MESMDKLFANKIFYLIPNQLTKYSALRKTIYKKHGAVVRQRPMRTSNEVYILLEKPEPSELVSQAFDLRKKLSKLQEAVVPVVASNWASDSIDAGKLLPLEQYCSKEAQAPSSPDTDVGSCSETEISSLLEKRRKVLQQEQEEVLRIGQRSTDSSNELIIKLLSQMREEHKAKGESFHANSYRKAIESISKCSTPILSYNDAIKLSGVGNRIASKVEEILRTGKLRHLGYLRQDERSLCMKLFQKIYGVGPLLAETWYNKGLRSLDDISEKVDNLTGAQRLGIKYIRDWNTKMPRSEVSEHLEFVRKISRQIDPSVEIEATGSYRRGLDFCGDVDFFVTKRRCNDMKVMGHHLFQLVNRLQEINYLECTLVHVVPKMEKFYGGGRLPNNEFCRRIDFLNVPWSWRGASLIYFTGNDTFNRAIRQLASVKGMHLSNKGLFKEEKGEQKLIESFDERKIFDILGVEWREPKDRNVGDYREVKRVRK